MTKICSKCKEEKPLAEFSKDKRSKDNLQCRCKKCDSIYKSQHSIDYKEEISKSSAEYYEKHKELFAKNRIENKEEKRKYDMEYYEKNKESIAKKNLEHYEVNKEIILNRNLKYQRQRKKDDPLFKLMCNIRTRIGNDIRNGGYKKNSKTEKILGCTFKELKIHLENQFTDGMNWGNYGLWHLDHIYPVSRAINEEHLYQLNHYTNFQPLWAEDNIKKGNKII